MEKKYFKPDRLKRLKNTEHLDIYKSTSILLKDSYRYFPPLEPMYNELENILELEEECMQAVHTTEDTEWFEYARKARIGLFMQMKEEVFLEYGNSSPMRRVVLQPLLEFFTNYTDRSTDNESQNSAIIMLVRMLLNDEKYREAVKEANIGPLLDRQKELNATYKELCDIRREKMNRQKTVEMIQIRQESDEVVHRVIESLYELYDTSKSDGTSPEVRKMLAGMIGIIHGFIHLTEELSGKMIQE